MATGKKIVQCYMLRREATLVSSMQTLLVITYLLSIAQDTVDHMIRSLKI